MKDNTQDRFELIERPLYLDSDTFIPFKSVTIKWSPEKRQDETVSDSDYLLLLKSELFSKLETLLFTPINHDKTQK